MNAGKIRVCDLLKSETMTPAVGDMTAAALCLHVWKSANADAKTMFQYHTLRLTSVTVQGMCNVPAHHSIKVAMGHLGLKIAAQLAI